jgi:hypothetical protein
VESGLHGRICKKKPLLSVRNIQRRLDWAIRHQNWSVEDWKKVLWSDEKKVELFNTKRRKHCRRRTNEPLRPDTIEKTVKHGGGHVMVWGCFLGSAVGNLKRIEGILEKNQMHQILIHHAVPSGKRLFGCGFWFQQDNDPKHTSIVCRNYLQGKVQTGEIKLLDWPAQSPDLNPIELLWDEVQRRLDKEGKPTSHDDLMEKIKHVWANIPASVLDKLVARMPAICKAVIAAKGGSFDEKIDVRKYK